METAPNSKASISQTFSNSSPAQSLPENINFEELNLDDVLDTLFDWDENLKHTPYFINEPEQEEPGL